VLDSREIEGEVDIGIRHKRATEIKVGVSNAARITLIYRRLGDAVVQVSVPPNKSKMAGDQDQSETDGPYHRFHGLVPWPCRACRGIEPDLGAGLRIDGRDHARPRAAA
jgi:hypothetical protein